MIHHFTLPLQPGVWGNLTWPPTLYFQDPVTRPVIVDLLLHLVLHNQIFCRSLVVTNHWHLRSRDMAFMKVTVGCWDHWIDRHLERSVPIRQRPLLMVDCPWHLLLDWQEEKPLWSLIVRMETVPFSVVPEIPIWNHPWTDRTFCSWVNEDLPPLV